MGGLILHGTLQGWRINSRARVGDTVEASEPGNLSETTIRLVERIPYWAQCVSYGELERSTGLSKPAIKMRISSCGNRYLIFDDEGRLSRLKRDLSNCHI